MIYITKSELQTQQIRPSLYQRFKREFENHDAGLIPIGLSVAGSK